VVSKKLIERFSTFIRDDVTILREKSNSKRRGPICLGCDKSLKDNENFWQVDKSLKLND
jgi:hypothetical protein